MQCHHKTPDPQSIRALAEVLHQAYQEAITRGRRDWGENLAGVALFVDMLLVEFEATAELMGEYAVLPGDVRQLFVLLLNVMPEF